jgi:hypothetical protein
MDNGHPVFRVHRIGSAVVAVVLLVIGVVGFLGHPGYVTTHGTDILGMSCNGLLATISLAVGVILLAAAVRAGPWASTTAAVIGALFVLSGLLNLIVLHRSSNILAFTLPNVFFSLVVGIVLLYIGLYGRASSQLPADNPFRRARGGNNPASTIWQGEQLDQRPMAPEQAERRLVEIEDLANAEHAIAEGTATPQQEREVIADATARATERRQTAWRRAARDGNT